MNEEAVNAILRRMSDYLDNSQMIKLKKYLDSRTDNEPALSVSTKSPHARLQAGGVESMLRKMSIVSNVKHVHPHKFRRTMATTAIDIWISGNMSYTPVGLEISEGQVRRLHCEDPEAIKEIEDLLSNSTKEKGQSNCPFYTTLYMTRSDGTIGTVFPATDDCDMYNSGTGCYSMSAGSNERLWTLINQFQEIR